MELLTNGLLIAATLFAGGYCWVLARRVRELKSLDKGLGKSIVTLTRQIELARTTLEESRHAAKVSRSDLTDLLRKAGEAAARVNEATEAAHDIERGLRFQISQANERKRSLLREANAAPASPVSAPLPPEPASLEPRATRPASTVPVASEPELPPLAGAGLHTNDVTEREETPQPPAEAHAVRTESEDADHDLKGGTDGDVQAGFHEPVIESTAPEAGEVPDARDGSIESSEPLPSVPSAQEIEPWRPKRAASVLRAGADLLTLKPLKPRAAKVSDLPKPKALPPLGNPLRNKSVASPIDDEDELLEALSLLAAGGKR